MILLLFDDLNIYFILTSFAAFLFCATQNKSKYFFAQNSAG